MSETEGRLALVSNVAANYLRKNSVAADQIGTVISSIAKAVHDAAIEIGGSTADKNESVAVLTTIAEKPTPAVSVKKSITRDFLICLDCGVHSRTLKRHLSTAHKLTPDAYRERWGLPRNYPVTAPAYSEQRSAMAKNFGLGQKGRVAKSGPAKSGARGRKART
jgi:predicted transcriptional regulator